MQYMYINICTLHLIQPNAKIDHFQVQLPLHFKLVGLLSRIQDEINVSLFVKLHG